MGSECSILNDTEHDVLITHGINWQSFTTAVTFLTSLAGAVAEYLKVPPAVIDAIGGLFGKLVFDGAKEDERKKTHTTSVKLIKPGEKYTWSGTLSLHMRVYVFASINGKVQCKERVCFTGPTAGAENVYSVSQDFESIRS